MKRHILLLILALALPVLAAFSIVYYGLPPDATRPNVALPKENTTAIFPPTIAASRIIPETLAEAKKMAKERFMQINKMSEEEWQKERLRIPYKLPPETRALAIERAQRRIDDLAAMNESHWEVEREKLLAREQFMNSEEENR